MATRENAAQASAPEQGAPSEKGFGERFEAEVGAQSRDMFEKILDHWPKFAGAVAVFVVLVAGYAGYNAYHDHQLSKSEQALNQVLLETQGAERLAALMRLRGEIAPPLLPRHRLEAIKAAQDVEDWATALEYWKLFADVAPDNWADLARIGQASARLHLGESDQAAAELATLRDATSEAFLPIVLLQIAEAAEAGGNWELALQTYEELQARDEGRQSEFLAFKADQIRQRIDDDAI